MWNVNLLWPWWPRDLRIRLRIPRHRVRTTRQPRMFMFALWVVVKEFNLFCLLKQFLSLNMAFFSCKATFREFTNNTVTSAAINKNT